jgi:hypothetical protein
MKAILEFDLEEDRDEFRNAIDGGGLRAAMWEMDQWLRSKVKYGMLPEAEAKAFREAREELHAILESHQVSVE